MPRIILSSDDVCTAAAAVIIVNTNIVVLLETRLDLVLGTFSNLTDSLSKPDQRCVFFSKSVTATAETAKEGLRRRASQT